MSLLVSRFKNLSIANQFSIVSIGLLSAVLIGVCAYMIPETLNSTNQQYQVVAANRASAVINMIDRNFYERFGDVQAFAFNKLAVDCAQADSANADITKFMNVMTSYYVLYDLMMICNTEGRVLAVNTLDKAGNSVSSNYLIGQSFSTSPWFQACMTNTGIEGGAWYSDFVVNDDVKKIYGTAGHGMAFSAPIKDTQGNTIGVWYNFANWGEVTGGIRKEAEAYLNQNYPGTVVLVTNSNHEIIDAADEQLMTDAVRISQSDFLSHAGLKIQSQEINQSTHVVGESTGMGAYTYKGNGWHSLVFLPQASISWAYFKDKLLLFFIASFAVLVLSAIMLYKFSSQVSNQINRLKNSVEMLALGQLPKLETINTTNEIGKMNNAIAALTVGMKGTAQFAEQIGQGNLNAEYKALSDHDVLGLALLGMQKNLQTIKVDEDRRSWATQGIAEIGTILRSQTEIQNLYNDILRFAVKYTHSNQGSLFLLRDETNSPHLELVSCYAWNRQKFIKKQIPIGEGLTGQCVLEKHTIFMTKLPTDYITITSGLGEAVPDALLIVPLIINDKVHGVLELASLKQYPKYVIEFVEKLTESIAAAINSIQINDRTKSLLANTQQQAEEMRAQEEEMRQNMEELSATQEEMLRKEREYQNRIAELEKTQLA
jgi:HAMP domain-containing protein